MTERIFIRPGYWITAFVYLVVTVGSLISFAVLASSEGQLGAAVFLAALGAAQVGMGWVMWRAAQVAVSTEGVSLPSGLGRGLLHVRRLAWSEIVAFERQEYQGRVSVGHSVVAQTANSGSVVVCRVPSHPLFDNAERLDGAVDRVLYLLERERRARCDT